MKEMHKNLVFQWNEIAGTESNREMQLLYSKLFSEEFTEYLLAVENQDHVEIMDGICDMLVIAYGSLFVKATSAYDQLGIADNIARPYNEGVLDKCFAEVMRSNFSKFCNTQEKADLTVEKYWVDNSIIAVSNKVGGYFVIRSLEDQIGKDGKEYPKGKILKSINYSKPNLKCILGVC